jgi:hypothetical protein
MHMVAGGLALGLMGCGAARPVDARGSARAPERLACPAANIPLPLGTPVVGRTRSGDSAVASSCVRRASPECSYEFEVPQRSDLRATLFSQDFDGALSLYALAPPREFGCADDSPLGDTHRARLDLTLEAGKYALHVEGASERSGDFELFAELDPLPPIKQVCARAGALPAGVFQRGSTRGAASMFDDSCQGRGKGPDQVYKFALDVPSRVRVREQSEFDALLSLRAECTGPELACSDDAPHGYANLCAELPAGSYHLVVDGHVRGDGGDYVLAVELAAPPADIPHERRCEQLPALREDALQELDTFYEPATTSASCGGDQTPESLYMFVLREPRRVFVYASEFEFDAVFSLRRACEYAESEVICAAPPRRMGPVLESAEQLVLELELPAGDYMLGIDGAARGEMGAGSLRLRTKPALSAASRAP